MKDVLIHARPFSICHCDMRWKLKNLQLLRGFAVKAHPEKLSHYFIVPREFRHKVCGLFFFSLTLRWTAKRLHVQLARKDSVMVPIDLKNRRATDVELLHELTKEKEKEKEREGEKERERERAKEREILSSTHTLVCKELDQYYPSWSR